MNFILCEHDVLGLKASTARSKSSGIRFYHIISGKRLRKGVGEVGILGDWFGAQKQIGESPAPI